MAFRKPLDKPLALGTAVSLPYEDEDGTEKRVTLTIGVVGVTGGERYYWLDDAEHGVAMLPWFVVEPEIP